MSFTAHPLLLSAHTFPSLLPVHSLPLAKAYSYGKQGTAGYDSDDASGYSYQSTPYVYEDEDSPVISSSDEEEESEPEELEETLEDCSLNESHDAVT